MSFEMGQNRSSKRRNGSSGIKDVSGNKPQHQPQWRSYGLARRREILAADEAKGGTSFHMNTGCSVYKYFQVSQRAIEQFHRMTRDEKSNLEGAYIKGHRMVCFLSKFLPTHPDYANAEVADLREACQKELERIRESLSALALRIDEFELNKFFADDFDPILDDDDSSESSAENESYRSPLNRSHHDRRRAKSRGVPVHNSPKAVTSVHNTTDVNNWEPFAGWKHSNEDSRDLADSPTPETVATSGTGSFDTSSDEDVSGSDYTAERRLEFNQNGHFESPTHQPRPIFSVECEVDLNFLKRIANEDVRYETDSEAVDSWAQDNDSIALLSASSGFQGITYDPAKLVLRELCSNRPSPVKEESRTSDSSTDSEEMEPTDPTNSSPQTSIPVEAKQQDATLSGRQLHPKTPEPQQKKETPWQFLQEKENEPDATLFSAFVKPEVLEKDEWVSFDSQLDDFNGRHRINFRDV